MLYLSFGLNDFENAFKRALLLDVHLLIRTSFTFLLFYYFKLFQEFNSSIEMVSVRIEWLLVREHRLVKLNSYASTFFSQEYSEISIMNMHGQQAISVSARAD